ncbi:MAG: hypothetical protein LIP01_13750, partial [Tannerellaceae bacterium]|nr:hypothetical protein [Tannerellaceae bacterium]
LYGFLIIGLTILLYVIGAVMNLEELFDYLYSGFIVPVVVAILSWIVLQLSNPWAEGRKLLKLLLWLGILTAFLFVAGRSILFYYFSGWGRTT